MRRVRPLSRRSFLRASLGAAAALAGAGCGRRLAEVPGEVRDLHHRALVLDLHVDTLLWMRLLGYDIAARHENRLPGAPFAWHMDLPRAREGGLDGAVLGLVIDPVEVRDELIGPLKLLARLEDDAGIAQTLRTLDLLQEAARRLPDQLAFCRTGSELRAAIAAGRFAALAGLEGSHGIESDLANVRAAHERGLRMIGLTHFQASSAAYPMTVAAFDGQGLTDFGRELIGEMERLPMVVDIAHVNAAGVDEALERMTRPFVVSHTACRGVHGDSRNLTDDQIRRIADRGGVIGIAAGRTFVGRPGVAGFVDHVEHALRVGGADCVAIGSDWDGAIVPVKGMEDVTSLPHVTAELLARGHSEEVARKFLGENALRALSDALG
jgi:membrane dipeptidase